VTIKAGKPLWIALPATSTNVQIPADTTAIAANNDVAGSAVVSGVPLAVVWHFHAPNKWKFMSNPYPIGAAGGAAETLIGKPSYAFGHVFVNGGLPQATIWNDTGPTGKIVKVVLPKPSATHSVEHGASPKPVLSESYDFADFAAAAVRTGYSNNNGYRLAVVCGWIDPMTRTPIATTVNPVTLTANNLTIGKGVRVLVPSGNYGLEMQSVAVAGKQEVVVAGHMVYKSGNQEVGAIAFYKSGGPPTALDLTGIVPSMPGTTVYNATGVTMNTAGNTGEISVTFDKARIYTAGVIKGDIRW